MTLLSRTGLCGGLAAALILSACTGGGASRVEPASVTRYNHNSGCIVDIPDSEGLFNHLGLSHDPRPGAINLNCLRFLEDAPAGSLAYTEAVTDLTARNRLAHILIAQSDEICTIEKALMLERQAEVNGILSIATTRFATAATIVTGPLASGILSGTAAFASATRDHINTHVWRNQIIQTVTRAIDTERTRVLGLARANFSKTNTEYTVDQMIADVNAYHQICSFTTGLQLVMAAVDNQAQADRTGRASSLREMRRELRRELHDEENEGNATLAAALLERINAVDAEIVRLETELNTSAQPSGTTDTTEQSDDTTDTTDTAEEPDEGDGPDD